MRWDVRSLFQRLSCTVGIGPKKSATYDDYRNGYVMPCATPNSRTRRNWIVHSTTEEGGGGGKKVRDESTRGSEKVTVILAT